MADVIIRADARDASAVGARLLAREARGNPAVVFGLATGGTPVRMYRALAEEVKAGLDLGKAKGFALDEYLGLPAGHPESYREVLIREFEPLGLRRENLCTPDPDPLSLSDAGDRYEADIERVGGIDVQILGIGTDGHIGFNEPGSSLGSRTRVKTLSERTRRDNARFFGGDVEAVPRMCLTQGVGTILRARKLLLLAFGEQKADAVRAALEGPITARCPASAIQLHPSVTVILDDAAASRLELGGYYRDADAGKPSWQLL